MAVGGLRTLPLLVVACTTTVLGQDIVFQEPNFRFNFGRESRLSPAPVAVEFPSGIEGSEVHLLRFGGSFDCRAPDGQLGRCGAFLDCAVMREALLPLTSTRLRFLKKSICRFSGGKPLICCPSKPPRLVSTTSAPLIFQDRRRTTQTRITPPDRLTTPAPTTAGTTAASTAAPAVETAPTSAVTATEPVSVASPSSPATTAPTSGPPAVTNAITTLTEAPTEGAPGFTTEPAPGFTTGPAPGFTTVPATVPTAGPAAGPTIVANGEERAEPSQPAGEAVTGGPAPGTTQTTVSSSSPTEPATQPSPVTAPEQTSPPGSPATSTVTSNPTPTPTPTSAATAFTVPAASPAERAAPVPPPGLDVCGHKLVERITGGRESLPNSWPWLAALGYELERGQIDFLCGGALITNQHILTAAHCIKPQLRVIRLGDHDLTNETEVNTMTERGVAAMWPHDKYNNRTLFNDIGIIKLSSPVTFTAAVNPICLPLIPEMREVNMVRKITFIAGWGTTKFKGEASPVLREAKVRVHRYQLCKVRYRALRHKLSEKQMCASAREDNVSQDTCQGDSGGPMMMPGLITPNWYVMGVVSFGFRCGEPRFPGVYTRVTEYLDWITDNLR